MALLKTPVCEFGLKAPDFALLGVDGKQYTLQDCAQKNGLLVMFICNHCPYVKAVLKDLLVLAKSLQSIDIGCVGICANDPTDYPEDSYENMQKVAKAQHFSFPYLVDESQAVAKAYGAVCTPDFFGYNANLELQFRGRINELLQAMTQVAKTGKGPLAQIPSQGCSIKWRE